MTATTPPPPTDRHANAPHKLLSPESRRNGSRAGALFAGGAFFIWGMVPLYFSAMRTVSPYEIIAHRVVWSALFLAILLRVRQGFAEARRIFARPRMLFALAVTSALVASNWLIFVWAVNAGRVLETSLGYFLTPQINVLFGFVLLRERLRRAQWIAVTFAAAGVLNQVWLLGQLPWVSLALAATFGSYGLARKKIAATPTTGLLVETVLASPMAVAYLGYLMFRGRSGFLHQGWWMDAKLVFLGIVTAVPLMLFAAGAQRLRLVTLAFVQYLAPSMTFVLAVAVYQEPLGPARALTFGLIWTGILIYTWDTVRRSPRRLGPSGEAG